MAVNNQVLQKMVDQASQKSPKSGSGGKLVAVLLTALVIGGGVWAYDNFMVIKVKDQALTEATNKVTELDNQNKNLAQQLDDVNKAKEEESKKMLTYSNFNYDYSFNYPANYTVFDLSNDSKHSIHFESQDHSRGVIILNISAKLPDNPLNPPATGQISVAGIMANKYNTGGEGTLEEPMTEVRFDKDNKTYSIQFYGVTDIIDQNLEILNSFQFNN